MSPAFYICLGTACLGYFLLKGPIGASRSAAASPPPARSGNQTQVGTVGGNASPPPNLAHTLSGAATGGPSVASLLRASATSVHTT